MKKIAFIFLLASLLVSCAPTPLPQVVDVYATAATQPWLDELYTCAASAPVTLNFTPDSPDLSIRLGEPEGWSGSAFQIGTEEIVIAASLQSPLPTLTFEQARTIFDGRGDPSVQVWGYAATENTQKLFDQVVMNGRGLTSFARLAVSPLHMLEALSADPGAVGVLPRRWMTVDLRELLVAASVPVLALTAPEPGEIVRGLIACMQKP